MVAVLRDTLMDYLANTKKNREDYYIIFFGISMVAPNQKPVNIRITFDQYLNTLESTEVVVDHEDGTHDLGNGNKIFYARGLRLVPKKQYIN